MFVGLSQLQVWSIKKCLHKAVIERITKWSKDIGYLSKHMYYLILTQYFRARNCFKHISCINSLKSSQPHGVGTHHLLPSPCPLAVIGKLVWTLQCSDPAHLWEHCTSSFLQYSSLLSRHVILTYFNWADFPLSYHTQVSLIYHYFLALVFLSWCPQVPSLFYFPVGHIWNGFNHLTSYGL